jgi:hypothetical protein
MDPGPRNANKVHPVAFGVQHQIVIILTGCHKLKGIMAEVHCQEFNGFSGIVGRTETLDCSEEILKLLDGG